MKYYNYIVNEKHGCYDNLKFGLNKEQEGQLL